MPDNAFAKRVTLGSIEYPAGFGGIPSTMALRLAPHALSHELWSSDRSFVLQTPLLFVPLDRAGRVARLWFVSLRNRPGRIDPAHHSDGCRVAGLSQINAYEIARLARRRA